MRKIHLLFCYLISTLFVVAQNIDLEGTITDGNGTPIMGANIIAVEKETQILDGFGISNESGLAFGWIVWTSQTLMILFFGSLSFFILPLVNRRK